jgi:uncharacterized SAM-binding protein YcdF (DUF218 family)
MIQAIVEPMKLLLRPSSVAFLIIVLAFGVALSFIRRTQKAARWYFVALLACYWIVAAPACAERLAMWEGGGYTPLADVAAARGATVVVVLGAGNSTIRWADSTLNQVSLSAALRVLEAVRLYRLLDRPTILVSGGITGRHEGARPEGEAMRDAVVQLGVPADHVVIEAESKTTRDEALVISRMLADRRQQPIVLVTSPTHMPRSLAIFRAAGLDPVPSVAPLKPDHWAERFRWLPNELGLWLFDTVVYDAAASWYYRLRGWT